ncbi:ester cyclase [Polymorphobacter sp.]|uniref:ester cyclase n=1 Tax=Polymorphobacter sp. TaxID=1909290 RepID=UPI003F6E95DA
MTMLTIGLSLLLAAGHPAPETQCTGQEANLATYIEMSRVLFNEREAERAGEFYAPEFISHNSDEGGSGADTVPVAYMTAMWNASKKNDPERQVINNLIVCNGDLVVAQVTTKGMRTGADNVRRRYSTSAMDIYRFKDGKVVERWGNNDYLTIIRQTGLKVDLSLTPLPPE